MSGKIPTDMEVCDAGQRWHAEEVQQGAEGKSSSIDHGEWLAIGICCPESRNSREPAAQVEAAAWGKAPGKLSRKRVD
jgi:hypothetical protein